MLQRVYTGIRSLDAYQGIAPSTLLDRLREVARDLRGARVLHVNATPYGGGVSELLRSAIPLLNGLGLVVDWKIISGDERFFGVTKALHNALQGQPGELSEADRAAYLATARLNAQRLDEEYDFVVVHDPQPAALPSLRGKGAARWVWRCHIDTSSPNPEAWDFLRPFLAPYDAAIFTMAAFVPPGFPVARVAIVPPAIDPLSPKNFELPDHVARSVLEWIGVRLDRPLVTQVSRFDPWKDPLGVIEAYRLVRADVPDLQLAMVGSMALDDPEGWEVYRRIREEADRDPKIHVFTNLTGVGNIEVNAFQRESEVVIQKSIREGFGLVVSEALWKETPVVAGRAGGIPLQMADGVGGALVDDVPGCAAAIRQLLEQPERARDLARAGRRRVQEHFLIPRLLLDELTLLREFGTTRVGPLAADRDPVCGMAVIAPGAPTADHAGRAVRFCSEECRLRFMEAPDRFVAEGAAPWLLPGLAPGVHRTP